MRNVLQYTEDLWVQTAGQGLLIITVPSQGQWALNQETDTRKRQKHFPNAE